MGIGDSLGEGRVLKTMGSLSSPTYEAYHLGEGRVLKTVRGCKTAMGVAYHLGEGRVLKTFFAASSIEL